MDTNIRRWKRATTFRRAGWLAVASMIGLALAGPATTFAAPSGDGTWAKGLPASCSTDTTGTMLWVWNGDGSPGVLTINGQSQGNGWTQQGGGAWHFTVAIAAGSNYVPTLASVAAGTGNLELSGCNEGAPGKASPTLGTVPSAGGVIGTVLNDTATLTGANSPTGSIVFNLYGPGTSCDTTPIYTQTVSLSGNSAATSPGFTTLAAGTYEWTASYAGDANNNAANSGCGEEAVVITTPGKVPTTPTPTPTGTTEAATGTPAPSSTGHIEGATGKPHVTPPPTNTLGIPAGEPAGYTWRIALLGLAALLASLLVFSPKTSPERRRR